MKQVWLTMHQVWSDVLVECDMLIAAQDVDGVMVYVVKDGQERTRTTDQ